MSTLTGILLFISGSVAGGGFLFWIYYKVFVSPTKSNQQVPKIGGQNVPRSSFEIDFSKAYRVACFFGNDFSEGRSTLTFFDSVRILGFSGPPELAPEDSLFYLQRWLVLEIEGEKRIYMPASSIAYLEELVSNG